MTKLKKPVQEAVKAAKKDKSISENVKNSVLLRAIEEKRMRLKSEDEHMIAHYFSFYKYASHSPLVKTLRSTVMKKLTDKQYEECINEVLVGPLFYGRQREEFLEFCLVMRYRDNRICCVFCEQRNKVLLPKISY